jgi:dTDP-4-dehydrorhamnose 3,5-epimerase
MWDNREGSETFRCVNTLLVGQDNPVTVLVPAGVVHAYQNVGELEGIVINCPNRLYRGAGRKQEVDEIRHEDVVETIFRMDD